MAEPNDTPERLIAAAERLFAEGGEAATSLRAVARVAHANAAAVHYHFGGRDELLRVVFERHRAPVAERRRRLLDEAAADDPPSVARVVEAVVRPDLELLAKLRKHRVQIARFLGRSELAAQTGGEGDETQARAVAMLRQARPELSSGEIGARLRLTRLAVAGLFAAAVGPGQPAPLGTTDPDEQVRLVVAQAATGLAGPPAGRPRGGKRRKPATAVR